MHALLTILGLFLLLYLNFFGIFCLMVSFLLLQVEDNVLCAKLSTMENYGWGDIVTNADIPCGDDMQCDNIFGIHPFYIEKGDLRNLFLC